MGKTRIPYSQRNYETVGGCDKIKSGCKNCYAIPLIHRMNCCQKKQGRYKGLVKDGDWTGKVELFEDRVEQPLHRGIPTTYFVNSRSDTFHKDVPWAFIDKIHTVMALCPQHKFLLFTKRWERARNYYTDETYGGNMRAAVVETNAMHISTAKHKEAFPWLDENCGASLIWPLPNVHLYFSAGTQPEVDEAVSILLEIPVAVRGLSLEPFLEALHISSVPMGIVTKDELTYTPVVARLQDHIDSIIVGCESGTKRRPCKIEWVDSIVDQCKEAGVPCYVKQINTTDLRPPGVFNNKVSTKPEEWPPSLRVRDMPK